MESLNWFIKFKFQTNIICSYLTHGRYDQGNDQVTAKDKKIAEDLCICSSNGIKTELVVYVLHMKDIINLTLVSVSTDVV